ncbi:MAG: cytochrome c biogenesis CcdA family protein [bacterium]
MENVTFLIALGAGILSFLSPCVLPLLPSYLSFITGISLEELIREGRNPKIRKITLIHSLMFILGFSLIFILLGASASLAGKVLIKYQGWIARIGGAFIILLGIQFTGLINLNFLQKERKFHLKEKPTGYFGSSLVGVVFAAGWTPCIGPILASILFYASLTNSMWSGITLLAVYSAGFALPFFLVSLGLEVFLERYQKLKTHLRLISIISGIFLIGVGILLMTNYFLILTASLNRWFPFLSRFSF